MQDSGNPIPDCLDDIPPPLAEVIERSRAAALACLGRHDYRLIIPPLAEYLETLTAGDADLDLQTFKMTDTLSGRTLGIRADQTPQIARYAANDPARRPRRYCYCGPVLRTRATQPWASRESLQLGAELFGLSAPAGDWEILTLALGVLEEIGIRDLCVDIGHAGLFAQLAGGVESKWHGALMRQIGHRDQPGVDSLVEAGVLSPATAAAMHILIETHGEPAALETARQRLSATAGDEVFDQVAFVSRQLAAAGIDIGINFSDLGTYGYHTGIVFTVYGGGDMVARGGRYRTAAGDEGAGFGIDLRQVCNQLETPPSPSAVSVPLVGDDAGWRAAVGALRADNRRVCFVEAGASLDPPLLEKQGGEWRVRER